MSVRIGGFSSLFYSLKKARQVGFFSLWKALRTPNACKTCALGMGGQKGGMVNEQGRFPEVCKKSIQAMVSDMQGELTEAFFKKYSLKQLQQFSPRELETAGRLSQPLWLPSNGTHYQPITWDEAFEKISAKIKLTYPQRSFFYFSGRSSNEAGFLLQLFARLYGTNHVNNCSYYCHQASGVGLTGSLGSSTATLSIDDLEKTDLLFLFGGNPPSNHPRFMTSLMHLKKRGAKVIVVNPVKEPGLVKFHVPSNIISLFFGTSITNLYVQPEIGGDIAFITGIAKELIERGAIDKNFIDAHTQHWAEYSHFVETTSWEEITKCSGVSRETIKKSTEMYIKSQKTVFAWTMGLTHHTHGVANIQSLINLALLRGMVGKEGAGLLPLRGHSNVQGMGTMGVTPELKKTVFQRLEKLGFTLPTHNGYDTMACMEAADRDEIDVAFCLGGNLYGSNPDLSFAQNALKKIDLVVALNTTLNTGHASGVGKETLILPVAARDEERQLTTQESMFNFVRVSDGGQVRLKNIKSEVEIISTIAAKILGNTTPIDWSRMGDHQNIRNVIAETIPGMEALKNIDQTKKEFVIPGRIFHRPQFNTKDGRARFATHPIPKPLERKSGEYNLMSVRSEGQFNTVVYEEEDLFRGTTHRNIIFMNPVDIKESGFMKDQKITVKSDVGEMRNISVKPFDIKPGNVLMYYPEVNTIIPRHLDPLSKTPSFKSTLVSLAAQK